MDFNVMNIFLYLAIILLVTKLFGLFSRKLGLPQVAGMVVAGLLIGPAIFSNISANFTGLINPSPIELDVLFSFAQVGVILILFSSGMETDLKELKKSGLASTLIAMAGVAVPLILGTLGAAMFMGGISSLADHNKLMNALFVGAILTATSVGITVETLRELGKLNTRVGTTILSAAIIDDVIGIIVLGIITAINGAGNIGITLLKALGFFVFTIGIGIILRKLFIWMEAKRPHTRRTGIFALAMCMFYAYCAEEFFGIAAITGAYMAGLMLSGMPDTQFVDRKIIVSGYMIFTPIFFAYIGISSNFSNFNFNTLLFGLVFVVLGIIGKIIGGYISARPFKYSNSESLTIGIGMISRGEVALAVYSIGHELIYTDTAGTVLGIDPLVGTIMLIIISSVLSPILLKLMFKGKNIEHHDNNLSSTVANVTERVN